MPKEELTHNFIKGLKAPEKPIAFYDEVERGLILRLSKAGSKTFCYRYRSHGKNRRYTVGKFPDIGLADARKKVRSLRTDVENGNDPQVTKQEKKNREEPKKFKELGVCRTKQ